MGVYHAALTRRLCVCCVQRDKETFVTDLLTQKAKTVLTDHASQTGSDPLFLIMSYPNVHTPNE